MRTVVVKNYSPVECKLVPGDRISILAYKFTKSFKDEEDNVEIEIRLSKTNSIARANVIDKLYIKVKQLNDFKPNTWILNPENVDLHTISEKEACEFIEVNIIKLLEETQDSFIIQILEKDEPIPIGIYELDPKIDINFSNQIIQTVGDRKTVGAICPNDPVSGKQRPSCFNYERLDKIGTEARRVLASVKNPETGEPFDTPKKEFSFLDWALSNSTIFLILVLGIVILLGVIVFKIKDARQ